MRKLVICAHFFFLAIIVWPQSQQGLSKNRTIEGTVTDFFGVPWAGAKLKLKAKQTVYKSSSSSKDTKMEKETITDGSGKYSFVDLPEDSYEVTLLRIGDIGTLEETKETGILFSAQPYRLDFGVEVGAITDCQFVVAGFAKDGEGKPVGGAKILAINAFSQRTTFSAITDKNGFYNLRICGLGQYIVFLSTPKYQVVTTSVTFENNDDFSKKVDFNLRPLPQELLNWRK